jgi:hypothetical protein
LEIKLSGSSAIEFQVNATDGANTGEISGKAEIQGNRATFLEEKAEDQEEQCKVVMTLGSDAITLETTDCGQNFGWNVSADGKYKKGSRRKTISLSESGLLQSEAMETKFKSLVGADYKLFLEVSQLVSEEEDLDKLGAYVRSSGVRGMFTILGAIVMSTPDGKFMAALVYPSEESQPEIVRYYTNIPSFGTSLPVTINKWRERFPDRKVMGIVVPPATTPRSPSGNPAPSTSSPPTSSAPQATESSLKVKGLYLGMDIKGVVAILKQKLPQNQDFDVLDAIAVRQAVLISHGAEGIVGTVQATPKGDVVGILIGGGALDALFSASGMEASDFTQEFVNAYHIPEMKVGDDRKSWVYSSPDGYRVEITATKILSIVKIPNAAERRKSFD